MCGIEWNSKKLGKIATEENTLVSKRMALSIFVWVAIGAAATLLITALFAYCFIKRYTDPEEASCLVTLCGTIGISVTLFCVLIIPIDIYTVSYSLDQNGN